jgi:hypothetical protein
LINDAAGQTNLLSSGSVNTIKMDVDSNDFEFNGNQLKLVDTNYRSGEVIETFGGKCGFVQPRTFTVTSGTYSMPTLNNTDNDIPTGGRIPTNNGELFGTLSYTRAQGVKYIKYEFMYNGSAYDSHHIWSQTPSIDTRSSSDFIDENTDLAATNPLGFITLDDEQVNLSMNSTTNTDYYMHTYVVECVDTVNEENVDSAKIHWPVGSTYQLGTRFRNEHSTDNRVRIFSNYYNRNGGNRRFHFPTLYITAIAG